MKFRMKVLVILIGRMNLHVNKCCLKDLPLSEVPTVVRSTYRCQKYQKYSFCESATFSVLAYGNNAS